MADDPVEFSATQQEASDDGAPGAVARFPYDRMTVERFREAFPQARWRDELGAWFVPGTTAARRLARWSSREWTGVLAFADDRGRDAFLFEPIHSRYLETDGELVVRTPYSRAVIEALREVPWAHWDPATKTWRVPFRSFEELRRRWPLIEAAAQDAEPEARQQRRAARKASPDHAEVAAAARERRHHRHPVPTDALPPLGRVLMTAAGTVVFESVTGELVDPALAARFYPGVGTGAPELVWAEWRRPTHPELVGAWPARAAPTSAETARGWWQPGIEVLRQERRAAASRDRAKDRARAARDAKPA